MKNSFLTFIFAFIPGAGQMYQTYMKRGLSLITMFVLIGMASNLVSVLSYACVIVWMYSFFDTFNLRAQIGAGTAPKDDYLVHVDLYDGKMRRVLSESHRLLGWGLIVLGVLVVYENVLMRLLDDIMWRDENSSALLRTVYLVCDQLPSVFVFVVLVICGVWLVRGTKGGKKAAAAASDAEKPAIEEFCEYHASESADASEEPDADAEQNPERDDEDAGEMSLEEDGEPDGEE